MNDLDNAILDVEMNKKPTEFDAYFVGSGISFIEYRSVALKKKAKNDFDAYIREMVKYARAMGVNFNALRDKTVDIYFNSSALV